MNDDFYQLARGAIEHHLQEAGVPFEVDEGDVVVDSHRLGLSIAFEQFHNQGGQIIAPLDVQIHFDGDEGDRFRVGTLGVGADRQKAMEAAVAEWHLLAASPLLSALGAVVDKRGRQRLPQEIAGWKLFPGRVGIRGRMPPGLEAGGGFYRELLGAIHVVVSKWPRPDNLTLRSIFIMATCGAETEVQAAVDGFLSAELTELLSKLAWPAGPETYLYKQLFVLRAGKR